MPVAIAHPEVRAAGAIASGTGTIAPALPTGTLAGDLLLMFLETDGAETPTASGWAQLAAATADTGSGSDTKLTVLWKIAAGGDATTTNDPGDHVVGRILGIKRCTFDKWDPFSVSQTSTDTTSDTSGSITGATTDRANCLVVVACSNGDDPGANGTANFSGWTNANLGSITEQIDNTRTDGNGGGVGVATGTYDGPGAFGSTDVTLAVASLKGMVSLAVQPPLAEKGYVDGQVIATPAGTYNHHSECSNGDTIHFFYRDSTNLMYRRSTDAGLTWNTAADIGDCDEVPLDQSCCVFGSTVIVLYDRANVLYVRRSTDGGSSWSSESTFSTGSASTFWRVSIEVEETAGQNVHAIYTLVNDGTYETTGLLYRRSTDGGANWAAETEILSGSTGDPGRPVLAVVGTTLHLTWSDKRHGSTSNGGEVYYAKSTDNGDNWSETRITTTASQDTLRPGVCASESEVTLAWQYPVGDEEIWFTHSTDGGATWQANAQLSGVGGASGFAEHAFLAQKGKTVCLVWTDTRYSPYRTFVTYSDDAGVSFPYQQVWAGSPAGNTSAPRVIPTVAGFVAFHQDDTAGVYSIRLYPAGQPVRQWLVDDFNRADTGPQPSGSYTLGAAGTGTYSGGGLVVISNAMARQSSGSFRQGARYNAKTFGDRIRVTSNLAAWTNTTDNEVDTYVTIQQAGSGTADGYALVISYDGANVVWTWQRVTNGSGSGGLLTSSIPRTVVAGDHYCAERNASSFTGWHKGESDSPWYVVLTATDSNFPGGGQIGWEMVQNQETRLDNVWVEEPSLPPVRPARRAYAGLTMRGR